MRTLVLVDGYFLRIKCKEQLGKYPTAQEAAEVVRQLLHTLGRDFPERDPMDVFRINYYESEPFGGKYYDLRRSMEVDFSSETIFHNQNTFLSYLANEPDFVVIKGKTHIKGYKLQKSTSDDILYGNKDRITPEDLTFDFTQKQVDMLIALDIVLYSINGLADHLVFITGDSDFVPVLNWALQHGIKITLATLAHSNIEELKFAADRVINEPLSSLVDSMEPGSLERRNGETTKPAPRQGAKVVSRPKPAVDVDPVTAQGGFFDDEPNFNK